MICGIERVVLTVADVAQAVAFYERVLQTPRLAQSTNCVMAGSQCIQFQCLGEEMRHHALEGAAHLCMTTDWTMPALLDHLTQQSVLVLEGPVAQSTAQGHCQTLYLHDLDNNLIELRTYAKGA